MIYDFLSQVLSLIPAETISGLEDAINTSINKNAIDPGIEDSEKISSVGKEFRKTLTFLGHMSHSGDLLQWLCVRRRPSCVNLFCSRTMYRANLNQIWCIKFVG